MCQMSHEIFVVTSYCQGAVVWQHPSDPAHLVLPNPPSPRPHPPRADEGSGEGHGEKLQVAQGWVHDPASTGGSSEDPCRYKAVA